MESIFTNWDSIDIESITSATKAKTVSSIDVSEVVSSYLELINDITVVDWVSAKKEFHGKEPVVSKVFNSWYNLTVVVTC